MPLTIVITTPRTPLFPQVKSLARGLAPLAAPLLGMAIDASGLGLPARLLLHAALHTTRQLGRTHTESSGPQPSATAAALPPSPDPDRRPAAGTHSDHGTAPSVLTPRP
ncbi:hypothetical protein Shyhy01_08370 [Streptomyces hygroscopicus subsp. hygroscopicus]|nr:hypothetical protein Shyhy01_08370 [Streptomyces hygroscopicus subsp. hygroscopicus]